MDRPILFSSPMVRALLDGTKTQTRRIAKLNAAGRVEKGGRNWHVEDASAVIACPYGAAGDLLWVRENGWQRMGASGSFEPYYYDASVTADEAAWLKERPHAFRRRPSIHMPRAASRITLKVTDVRLDRLHSISLEDCAAEGVKDWVEYGFLWDSINGAGSWAENPRVWAVSFQSDRETQP